MAEKTTSDPKKVSTPGSSATTMEVDMKMLADINRKEIDHKLNAIKLIMHWHEYLLHKVELSTKVMKIDIVADATSVCKTVHDKFRQEANALGGLSREITDTFEFKINTKTLKFQEIKDTMRKLASSYGFNYQTADEGRKITGILSAVLSLITTYRARFNEVIIGNNTITLQEYGQLGPEIRKMSIRRFGLESKHGVLLSGCTYNPILQSSLKQYLGPMTIVINLCQAQGTKCQEAWIKAFCNAYKLIPEGGAAEIARELAGKRFERITPIRQLADISLFGITRCSNKAYFPASFFLTLARTIAAYANKFDGKCTETIIKDEDLHHAIRNIDFSGHGMWHFWNQVAHVKDGFIIRRNNALTDEMASEMVLHAVFGTHNENLSLLKWMTGHEFHTRRGIKKALKGRSNAINKTPFPLISFVRICKLATASQTNLKDASILEQISRQPTLSETCHKRVNLTGLLPVLREKIDPFLILEKESTREIVERLGKDLSVFETTEFFNYDANLLGKDYGNPVEIFLPASEDVTF